MPGKILIADYDRAWPRHFELEAAYSGGARRPCAAIEHAGSTSVPGLAANPIIDIILEVADSADEAAWLPYLQARGYVLRVREPEWNEHRMLKGPGTDVNLHVYSAGCPEVTRMLRFRDWLRTNPEDRDLYVRVKRDLAARDWENVQKYADAKTKVVEEILARAARGQSML